MFALASGGRRTRRSIGSFIGALALLAATSASAADRSAQPRNDYAEPAFSTPLRAGLRAFFTRDFNVARGSFERALGVVPDNTLAIALLNATAVQIPGNLDRLIDAEEDAVGKRPTDYVAHVRLAFSYLFATQSGRDREPDAREELNIAVGLMPQAPAAHVGLGIMRETQRSKNRAKVEFLAALRADENNVLAREYLALIYQADLKDPQRGLAYIIDIPNVLPEYADIDYHIASLLDDLDQPDAAITYATRGLQADLGHVGEAGQHGYTLLAHIYLNERKPADARRVLKASIAADADAVYAATLLRKLDRGEPASAHGAPSSTKP